MYSATVKRASKKNPKQLKSMHTFFGKTAQAVKSAAKAFVKKNIAEGFWDGGIFHPIRASSDYSRGRAGEGRSKTAKKVRARQMVRRHGRKARRRRTAIS